MFLHSHREELTSSNALQSLDVGEKSDTTSQSFNYELESTTASPRILSDIDELGLRLVEDGFVRWKPDATGHPRNWGLWRKAFDSGVILMLDLFTLVCNHRNWRYWYTELKF